MRKELDLLCNTPKAEPPVLQILDLAKYGTNVEGKAKEEAAHSGRKSDFQHY